jgi:hypothetical protein
MIAREREITGDTCLGVEERTRERERERER